jgi:hypothetical protein
MLAAESLPSVSSDMICRTLCLIISQVYSLQAGEYDEYEAGLGKKLVQTVTLSISLVRPTMCDKGLTLDKKL